MCTLAFMVITGAATIVIGGTCLTLVGAYRLGKGKPSCPPCIDANNNTIINIGSGAIKLKADTSSSNG